MHIYGIVYSIHTLGMACYTRVQVVEAWFQCVNIKKFRKLEEIDCFG